MWVSLLWESAGCHLWHAASSSQRYPQQTVSGPWRFVCCPKLPSHIVACAKTCKICQTAGMNSKPNEWQNEFGAIRKPKEANASDFMRQFAGVLKNTKDLRVAFDPFPRTPLKIVKTNDMRVEKFLRKYIRDNGIPQKIWTKHHLSWETIVSKKRGTRIEARHIVCSVHDHRGNGKA